MLWSGNKCGKSKAMRIKATIPSTYYDKNNWRMWNISTIWVA
jgi:hypothetical protein